MCLLLTRTKSILRMRFICWLLLVPVFAIGQRQEFFHPQMGTLFQIIVPTADSNFARQATNLAFARIDSLNQIFSDYQENSEISRLSKTAGTDAWVKVSPDMWRLLRIAQKISRQSNGAFDITIGALTKVWRKAFRQSQFPTNAEIAKAKHTVDYRSLRMNGLSHKVKLLLPDTRLDAGGIAKGYAVDAAMKVLRKAGIRSALVAGGGDVRVSNPPPDKAAWIIATKGADATGQIVDLEKNLNNRAISTSGDTYRFLEWEGIRYSHIIDPRSGMGIQHRQFTRVSGPRSTLADALATAANVLPIAERDKLAKKFPKYLIEVY